MMNHAGSWLSALGTTGKYQGMTSRLLVIQCDDSFFNLQVAFSIIAILRCTLQLSIYSNDILHFS
jgi:hypothetical protein